MGKLLFTLILFFKFVLMINAQNCEDYSQLSCTVVEDCVDGELVAANCTYGSSCEVFTSLVTCVLCEDLSSENLTCSVVSEPCDPYDSSAFELWNCTVRNNSSCLGDYHFQKVANCYRLSKTSWKKSVILSMFLGGFGVDRFYMGYTFSGLIKLISFGGAGIWTFVDFIRLLWGTLPPADGGLWPDYAGF
eukprot:GCRY01001110.1.p1 GENE.GCRY01001110.1~~GCRY01001110.1.p1  ORF type:complete len:190 (-),score=8.37 GCRY01001110.1:815-1384(-)